MAGSFANGLVNVWLEGFKADSNGQSVEEQENRGERSIIEYIAMLRCRTSTTILGLRADARFERLLW